MTTPQTKIAVFRTARDTGERLAAMPELAFQPAQPGAMSPSIMIDARVTYQEYLGFGGAFTEAAAVTLRKMPPEKQAEILNAYFNQKTGHGYTLGRTHINSCDFALGNYACDDVDGDFELRHFSIEHDRQAIIPMIHAAQKIAGAPLTLFASPWSPPAWMKTNGEMNHGGNLKPECRDAWARYYCRYIREFEKEGIAFWGLTVQNEPEATQTWDSCVYTGEEERDFVRDHLGPTLTREGLSHLRVIIWDHNRDRLYERAKVVFDDPQAAQYVWGAGFHWYVGDYFDNAQRVHDAYPDKHLMFTEGCQEGGTHFGSWLTGERYANSIINDLNRWTEGWLDWNLLLDETGGPNHVGNFCSAPILADTQTGQVHYQSSYYYIGHFARFIRPGATRILCATTLDEPRVTAFRNPDGRIAVVMLNPSERPLSLELKYQGMSAAVELPRRSIQTALFSA